MCGGSLSLSRTEVVLLNDLLCWDDLGDFVLTLSNGQNSIFHELPPHDHVRTLVRLTETVHFVHLART